MIVTVPSQIPGRPDLSFQSIVGPGHVGPDQRLGQVGLPDALRGNGNGRSLIPLPRRIEDAADTRSPSPSRWQDSRFCPATCRPTRLAAGRVVDAVDDPTCSSRRALFGTASCVSTVRGHSGDPDQSAGNFVLILSGRPPATASRWSSPPVPAPGFAWVTLPRAVSHGAKHRFGAIKFPAVLKTTNFQVTVHGGARGRAAGVGARCGRATVLEGGDARVSARFITGRCLGTAAARRHVADAGRHGRAASVHAASVIPPPGSMWRDHMPGQRPGPVAGDSTGHVAARCDAAAPGGDAGAPCRRAGCRSPRHVTVQPRRPVPMPHCLAGPTATTTITDATGSFTLPLELGPTYSNIDPPRDRRSPRMIELQRDRRRPTRIAPSSSTCPSPLFVEGDDSRRRRTSRRGCPSLRAAARRSTPRSAVPARRGAAARELGFRAIWRRRDD